MAAFSVEVMPNRASRLVPQLAQRIQFGIDLLEPRRHAVQQPLAGFRRRNAAGRAGQQPDADPSLQVTDGLTQRRLRDAEFRRGACEAALLGDRDKGCQVMEALSRPLISAPNKSIPIIAANPA